MSGTVADEVERLLMSQAEGQSRWSEAKDLGKRFGKEFSDDDVTGLAAEVAYYLIFAIPPLLILMVTVAALINAVTNVPVVENLQQIVNENAPADLQQVLNSVIDSAVGQVSGGAASLGVLVTLVIALWSGSNGVGALMKAFNRAHDVEEGRPFIKKKLVAIGLTILLIVLVNLSFVLFVFGGSIGQWLAEQAGMSGLFTTVWNLARWPIAIIAIMVLLAVLYYLGPHVEQSFQWISPGSIVATILWVIAAFGFQIYLSVADPGSAYGAFGSVIVFLLFLYITGLVFLTGAEINAILQKRYDEEVVRDRAEHPERLRSGEAQQEAQQAAAAHGITDETQTPQGRQQGIEQSEQRGRGQPMPPERDTSRADDERRATDQLARGLFAGTLAAVLGRIFGRQKSRGE